MLIGLGGLAFDTPTPGGVLEILPPYAFLSGTRVELDVPDRALLLGGPIGAQALAWRGTQLELSPAIAIALARD